MNILFLDDNKKRQKDFRNKVPSAKIVSTAEVCINNIQKEEVWNILFLEGETCGGTEIARWIVENEPQVRNIIVHAQDPDIGMEMVQLLKGAQYQASYMPFSTMIKNMEKVNG